MPTLEQSLTQRSLECRKLPKQDKPLCQRSCSMVLVDIDRPSWRCERCLRYVHGEQAAPSMPVEGQGGLF